ncbi:hypothetical protein P154DRAFT_528756 [Amniculicola lignicola CBS 123094]|uniref:C2H2-type domain-containing protein n=1 Tax=Amniculicola lignicola CBS 123094 TaxID=1392246 RepID=A0A6A5X592_9PLEO|nr:hypothetical protein P154DRAFT_528756 [Amniculicola lignicola CBS 123094]
MALIRKHMKRYHEDLIPFLERCKTCHQHFFDPEEFFNKHGIDGRLCWDLQTEPEGMEGQWKELCGKLIERLRLPPVSQPGGMQRSNTTSDQTSILSPPANQPSLLQTVTVGYDEQENRRTLPVSRGSSSSVSDVTIQCGCGKILTGPHARGNLTRHQKSEGCTASDVESTRYTCPIAECGKSYARSDGLRAHIRRKHPEFFQHLEEGGLADLGLPTITYQ